MHYVGIDYHKKRSYITVVDERGKVVKKGQIANSKEALAAMLEGTERETSAVLEAGRNWPVMYDWLEELVEEVTLAHPAKVRVIAEAKVKTDRIDSRMLAQLLRADLEVMEHIKQCIKAGDGWVAELARMDARAKLLATLPGIGNFLSLLLAVEIDEVGRFYRAQKLCAYAGLVPSTYASGGYVHHGRITKSA